MPREGENHAERESLYVAEGDSKTFKLYAPNFLPPGRSPDPPVLVSFYNSRPSDYFYKNTSYVHTNYYCCH